MKQKPLIMTDVVRVDTMTTAPSVHRQRLYGDGVASRSGDWRAPSFEIAAGVAFLPKVNSTFVLTRANPSNQHDVSSPSRLLELRHEMGDVVVVNRCCCSVGLPPNVTGRAQLMPSPWNDNAAIIFLGRHAHELIVEFRSEALPISALLHRLNLNF